MSQSTTSQHDTNPLLEQRWFTVVVAGQLLVNRPILSSFFMLVSVFQPTSAKCWASVASAAGLHSTPGSSLAGWARDYNEPCRPTYIGLHWHNVIIVSPPYVTPVQHRASIVSQRMSTRRKMLVIVRSIYGRKTLNPQKIATKGFSTDSSRG